MRMKTKNRNSRGNFKLCKAALFLDEAASFFTDDE